METLPKLNEFGVTNSGRYPSRELFLVTARLYLDYTKAVTQSLWEDEHAGSSWPVMWLIDKSVDGTVGQVQNCYFYQTSPPEYPDVNQGILLITI